MKTKSGKDVFPIGIGTWDIASHINQDALGGKYRGVEPVYGNEEAEIEAIRYSLSKGQNLIDCAEMYGGFYTDEVVGRAIQDVQRDDIYIADKLWKTSVANGLVVATVEAMLKKLGTDYLDMLYIHAPFADAPWREAIPQIDDLIDKGVVRDFAVSNFSVEQLKEAQALAKHPIVAVQQHFNVLYQSEADEAYRKFCKENDITIIPYRPLERKAVIENEVIRTIAQQHEVTETQIALAWLLALGMLPIPKATQHDHIDSNLAALKVVLSESDMQQLNNLQDSEL